MLAPGMRRSGKRLQPSPCGMVSAVSWPVSSARVGASLGTALEAGRTLTVTPAGTARLVATGCFGCDFAFLPKLGRSRSGSLGRSTLGSLGRPTLGSLGTSKFGSFGSFICMGRAEATSETAQRSVAAGRPAAGAGRAGTGSIAGERSERCMMREAEGKAKGRNGYGGREEDASPDTEAIYLRCRGAQLGFTACEGSTHTERARAADLCGRQPVGVRHVVAWLTVVPITVCFRRTARI